jgi:hypothetical protein
MSEAARGFENFILVGMQNLQNDDHERKVAGKPSALVSCGEGAGPNDQSNGETNARVASRL